MKNSDLLSIAFISIFCGLLVGIPETFPQTSADEQGVRAALARFKNGVDSGDRTLGPQLATGPYAPQFIQLYNMFVDGYRKYKMPLPLEVGHIKILRDGRAKVETYLNPAKNLFVFTLEKENDLWKFSHQEGILFPIFEFPNPPYNQILELPQARRSFMMAERDFAFRSYVYREVKKDRGEAAARDFFLDGPGFKVAMDAWLPFLEGAGQFAIFLAVLESNYYGSTCVVTKATEEEAEIQFKPLRDLEVLQIAVFDPKLTAEEFRALYTHIMKNRAETCGLEIDISIQGTDCLMKIKKK